MSKKIFSINKLLPRSKTARGVFIALIVLGLAAGILLSNLVSDVVAKRNPFNVPGVDVVNEPSPTAETAIADPNQPTPDPIMAPAPKIVEMPPEWDGKTRINILIMGLDYRDLEEKRAPHTDSMILFTMDPLNNTAGLVSIPRDLWVKIPNADYAKINTAYRVGEINHLPGGGPENAKKAVENLLGVPIQYYMQIDFDAFVKLVDHIKGVKIDIPEPITVDILGTNDVAHLPAGRITLPGNIALGYVRMRHTGFGDFDRAKRQQQVILAIKERFLEFNMLPQIVANSKAIYDDLAQGVQTNMDMATALSFLQRVLKVPTESIVHKVIDNEYVIMGRTGDQDILRPIPDKIRDLRDEVFTGQGINRVADLEKLLQSENASILVQNSSNTPGLETQTAEYLKSQGLNVVNTGTAPFNAYTTVTINAAKPHALRKLTQIFNISSPIHVKYNITPGATPDLIITFGDDWAVNNPMPK